MAVPSPSIPSAEKAALRADYRARRKAYAVSLAPEMRTALEIDIAALIEPMLAAATIVAAYQPMTDEPSPLPALARAAALGKVTALPAFVARDSRMTFRTGAATEAGPWGLLQPALAEPAVAPDLVLLPLVACDARGNRIGMGQGHYDRALVGLSETTRLAGIGWDLQLLDGMLEPDPWDQPLHAFVSPSSIRTFTP